MCGRMPDERPPERRTRAATTALVENEASARARGTGGERATFSDSVGAWLRGVTSGARRRDPGAKDSLSPWSLQSKEHDLTSDPSETHPPLTHRTPSLADPPSSCVKILQHTIGTQARRGARGKWGRGQEDAV